MTPKLSLALSGAAFAAAVLFALLAWHFVWRAAAFYSTGEPIDPQDLNRFHFLSRLFSALAIGALAGSVSLWWKAR